jgi:hypothetical protein
MPGNQPVIGAVDPAFFNRFITGEMAGTLVVAVKKNVCIEENLHRLMNVLRGEVGKPRIGINLFLREESSLAAPLSHKTNRRVLGFVHDFGCRFFRIRQGHLKFSITHFYDKFGSFRNGESGHAVEGKAQGGHTHLDSTLLSSAAPGNSRSPMKPGGT